MKAVKEETQKFFCVFLMAGAHGVESGIRFEGIIKARCGKRIAW